MSEREMIGALADYLESAIDLMEDQPFFPRAWGEWTIREQPSEVLAPEDRAESRRLVAEARALVAAP